jgi:hypothetical protein
MEDEGKRDRKREGVRYRELQGEKDSPGNKIDRCDANVRLIIEMVLLMTLFPRFASFLC